MTPVWPVHGEITGPIVMIGFGSIGKGTLPLIERHFTFDKSRFTVIDPEGNVVHADFRLDPQRFLAALGADDVELKRA